MAFNSISFAIFMAVIFALYWLLPHRFRWVFLLAASFGFYMSWSPVFILLLLFSTILSYFGAIAIYNAPAEKKKTYMTLLACLSLLPLFVFKYLAFVTESLFSAINLFGLNLQPATLKLALPLGISFYTFQTLGYMADVYRGRIEPERHPGYYALFVAFFPQIVSGPIGRAGVLIPQLRQERAFDYSKASRGIRLMLWGVFKKMVIADHLASPVDLVYLDLYGNQGLPTLLAVVFFAVQIYCDFSGYTDIARGCAGLLGIDLAENFRSPYFSRSIKEFWSRWHISLSTWFRDYVYIPLGGSRVGKLKHYRNLLVTFLVSGLWHGASWPFVVWGGVHGLAQIGENALGLDKKESRSRLMWLLRVTGVFIFSCLTWVFFRADTVSDALFALGHMFTGIGDPAEYVRNGLMFLDSNPDISKSMLCLSVAILTAFDYASLRVDVFTWLSERKRWFKYAVYLAIGLFSLLYHCHSNVSFIYFQF